MFPNFSTVIFSHCPSGYLEVYFFISPSTFEMCWNGLSCLFNMMNSSKSIQFM